MPRQKRTTKTLAQRIDLSYFKRPHPFRRWRLWLSVAAPVAALLWLGGLAIARRDTVYSAGPVSSAHAVFGARCELCHVGRGRGFSKAVNDDNCRTCHDGPVHQPNQVFTPPCASCHWEHQERTRLELVSDTGCTQCHSSLETKTGVHQFDPRILGFNTVHPEFRALQQGFTDPGTVKLNHEVHLKPGLKGPNGAVQMECGDCHRVPSQASGWPYGTAEFRNASSKASPDRPAAPPNNAYMAPIAYAKHCYACHVLLFDKRFTDPVPHDKPEIVHKFLVQRYSEYIAANPSEVRNVSLPVQRIPQQPELTLPRTPQEWVTFQVAQAELLLWQKTCKECHAVRPTAGPLPEIAKSAITARWFRHAAFDHQPHRMLDCTACHTRAPKSRETSDILLPGIKLCQQCHRSEAKTPHQSAEARCFECHTYHDWSKERPVKGKYGIRQIVEGGAPRGSASGAGALIP
ncbi:MAG: hypothetical protein ACHP78_00155 [Terriglobales bacterium]